MPEKTTTVDLPSGRSVTYRKATAYDNYRLQGSLPDLSADTLAEKMKLRDYTRLGLRTVCQLSVTPRFWCDLRTDDEIDRDPRNCPAGFVPLDLDDADLEALLKSVWATKSVEVEETVPLPVTVGA